MSADLTDLPCAVLHLVDRLPEPYCDRFGRTYMDVAGARALATRLAFLLIPVQETSDPGHLQIICGRPTLFHRASLGGDALTYLILDAVARHLEPGCGDDLATAFAFTGRLGADVVERGASWLVSSWRRLRELDGEWFQRTCADLPRVLEVVRACTMELNGAVATNDLAAAGWTARHAVLQARVARRRGALDRAQAFAALALRLGGDESATADAINCLARCDYQRGRIKAAAARWVGLAEFAEAKGMASVAGTAYINLASVAILGMDEPGVQRYTAAALRCFPPGHPEIALLAQNYARYRIDLGAYAAALPVLKALSVRPDVTAQVRTAVLTGLARCSAGTGDREGFEHAWYGALTILELSEEWVADACYELAEAAVLLGEWDRAERMAARGLTTAEAAQDGRAIIQLDKVRAKITRRDGARSASGVLVAVPWVPEADVSHGLAAALHQA